MPTDTNTTLLPAEARDLAHYEGVIQRGLTTFYEVGAALNAIKTDRLYRTQYATFDAYCLAKWGIGKSQNLRLREAAKTIENLETTPMGVVLPQSERQVRPLTAVPAEAQPAAWNQAVDAAGGEQPTGAQVSAAAADYLPHPALRPVAEPVDASSPPAVAALTEPPLVPLTMPDWDTETDDADDAPLPLPPPGDITLAASVSYADKCVLYEAALRALPAGGIVVEGASAGCLVGCRVFWYKPFGQYVHDDDCPLGIALDALSVPAELIATEAANG